MNRKLLTKTTFMTVALLVSAVVLAGGEVSPTAVHADNNGTYCKEDQSIYALQGLGDGQGGKLYNVISSLDAEHGKSNTLAGTNGTDLILVYDHAFPVTVLAFDGDDCIVGDSATSITVYGGLGDDYIHGGEKIDWLYGEEGNDTLYGGAGDDILKGAGHGVKDPAGNDTIYGEAGNDALYGDKGNDTLEGGDGDDTIYAGPGNDTVKGGSGDDYISAHYGDDYVEGNWGRDTISANLGNNTVYQDWPPSGNSNTSGEIIGTTTPPNPPVKPLTAPEPTYCLENLTIRELIASNKYNVIDERNSDKPKEKIRGTNTADLILVHDNGPLVQGRHGSDCIIGGSGDDRLRGGHGSDYIYGSAGNDEIRGGSGNDKLVGGEGNDDIMGRDGNDHITGGPGEDNLRGNKGNDTLQGDDDDVRIAGGQGHDICTKAKNTKPNCETHSQRQ